MKPTNFYIRQLEPKPLIWWITRRNQIDMNPKYQRKGRLWSTSDKAYLIDSIINEFDIPKLYIADFTWGDSPLNNNKLPYAIIDGKQRLEAIFDFYDGKIILNDNINYRKNQSLKLGGLSYNDLKKNYFEIAEIFDVANLTFMGVYSESEDLINELFVRLNRNKPLTGAEIRNAMTGSVAEIIRNISNHQFFTENIKFSINRATDKDISAKLLMFEFNNKIQTTKKVDLDKFVEKFPKDEETKNKIELAGLQVYKILDALSTIFLPKDFLLNTGGVVPVYYWFIREIEEKYYSYVRDFIFDFDEKRKCTLDIISQNLQINDVDQEIVQYINYLHSPNDASSIEGRYKILKRRFTLNNRKNLLIN